MPSTKIFISGTADVEEVAQTLKIQLEQKREKKYLKPIENFTKRVWLRPKNI